MKIGIKHIMIGSGAVLALSLMSFAKVKVSQAKELFSKMIVGVKNLSKLRIADGELVFNIDIVLQNPTAVDFSASTLGIIQAKVFRVYLKNELITHGTLNSIQGIDIPAGGTHVLKNIVVRIGIFNMIKATANEITGGDLFDLDKWKNSVQKQPAEYMELLKKLRYEIDIDAGGLNYTYKDSII